MKFALTIVAVIAAMAVPPAASATGRTDPEPTARLMAIGDLMLAGGIGTQILEDGPEVPWLGVAEDLEAADIVVANLECTVSTRGAPWPKRNRFRAPPVAVDSIASGGIDVVQIANNHSMDYGPVAFKDTLSLLDKHGIAHVGGGLNRASARSPVLMERNGLRVALLGYILPNTGAKPWYPGLWNATPSRAGLAVGTPENVTADVLAARNSADVVVVGFHGGYEHKATQSIQVLEFTRAAVAAGAALVIGTHPSMLEGYHFQDNALIAYSLGRFISDRGNRRSRDTAILDVTLSKAGVESMNWIPVVIQNGFAHLATGADAARIMARLKPI